jgi:hypothetical protein
MLESRGPKGPKEETDVVYFPTFFIQEVLLFVAVWILLYITSGRWSVVAVTHGPGCIPSNFAAGLRIETNLRGRC